MAAFPPERDTVQEPIELILVKHWASYVAVPAMIANADGNLIFFNESAEMLLGRTFDEAGEINAADLEKVFVTHDLDGKPLSAESLPLVRSLTERAPAHASIRFKAFDGSWREIDATAIPIIGQGERFLGSLAVFWEIG
jgi:PAS domain-containing protein